MNNMTESEVITEMLKHFKELHNQTNTSLAESGEHKRCKPFETIGVQDIKNYVFIKQGLDKSFIDL